MFIADDYEAEKQAKLEQLNADAEIPTWDRTRIRNGIEAEHAKPVELTDGFEAKVEERAEAIKEKACANVRADYLRRLEQRYPVAEPDGNGPNGKPLSEEAQAVLKEMKDNEMYRPVMRV